MDIAEYLEEEEIPILIENTPKLQKRAFLDCLYESGSRPEEFLRLSNLDCKIDVNGAILILRGKTGKEGLDLFHLPNIATMVRYPPSKASKIISIMDKPGN